jgi:uncharacterized membrane protein YhaH (DUF805 family)
MDYVWFLFKFEGRIDRAKCWRAALIILCWMIFFGILTVIVISIFGEAKSFGFGINDVFRVLDPKSFHFLSSADLFPLAAKTVGTLVFAWVYLATSIKRLHDRDKSGWWMIPFFVVPGLYNQFGDRLGDSWAMQLVGLIAFVLGVWGLIEMYFLKGTRGPNRFGPDSLAPVETKARWSQQDELQIVPHSAGPPAVTHVKRGND